MENWCGVLQEVALPDCGNDPVAFLKQAVMMANGSCWGTLSCSLFVPPDVQHSHPDAVDEAVASLKYGSVCINASSIVGFPCTRLSWGAFPGHTPKVISSLPRLINLESVWGLVFVNLGWDDKLN